MPSVLRYEEMEKNRFRIQRIDVQAIGSKLEVDMYPLMFYTENPLPGLIRNALIRPISTSQALSMPYSGSVWPLS